MCSLGSVFPRMPIYIVSIIYVNFRKDTVEVWHISGDEDPVVLQTHREEALTNPNGQLELSHAPCREDLAATKIGSLGYNTNASPTKMKRGGEGEAFVHKQDAPHCFQSHLGDHWASDALRFSNSLLKVNAILGPWVISSNCPPRAKAQVVSRSALGNLGLGPWSDHRWPWKLLNKILTSTSVKFFIYI